MSRTRFKTLPKEVWCDSVLQMCPNLVNDLQIELKGIGRYEDACKPSPKKVVGGPDQKATHDHFTWRFDASSMRTRYLALDPLGDLKAVSEDVLLSFADGKLAVLDVPCGSGAGILGFLSLIADLRHHNCISRLPLEVVITGGDYSEHARKLYDAMLARANHWLNAEGIRISWTTQHWDASSEPSTASLVDEWFDNTKGCEEYLVLMAAFSGAAASNFAKFERSFQHIGSRLHSRDSTLLMVEPRWDKGATFFEKVQKWFPEWFRNLFGGSPLYVSSFHWKHPFRNTTPNGTVEVLQYVQGGDGP